MSSLVYYVVVFHEGPDGLLGAAPFEASDYVAAIGEAQSRAQEAAGAIVIARESSKGPGPFPVEIIFRTGQVPESVTEFSSLLDGF